VQDYQAAVKQQLAEFLNKALTTVDQLQLSGMTTALAASMAHLGLPTQQQQVQTHLQLVAVTVNLSVVPDYALMHLEWACSSAILLNTFSAEPVLGADVLEAAECYM
jgi:hypothetical protein